MLVSGDCGHRANALKILKDDYVLFFFFILIFGS